MRRLLYAPLLAVYSLTTDDAIARDVRRLTQSRLDLPLPATVTTAMAFSALRREDFRSLFYYRLRGRGVAGKVLARVLSALYHGAPALYLHCSDIGPGMYISHGFATILVAGRVGQDCLLSQQVTVGYTDHGGPPTIGDRVRIAAGAKILGPIHVGDDAVIGANAVVINDVPQGAVVAGVPAVERHTARNIFARQPSETESKSSVDGF